MRQDKPAIIISALMLAIAIVLIAASAGQCGQYTAAHGDSVYAAYMRDIPPMQQPEPYHITCIIRYDDIAYQRFTVRVLWHYFVASDQKFRIIPVDGRPFMADNVEPILNKEEVK